MDWVKFRLEITTPGDEANFVCEHQFMGHLWENMQPEEQLRVVEAFNHAAVGQFNREQRGWKD
jgi:hypothetical protein